MEREALLERFLFSLQALHFPTLSYIYLFYEHKKRKPADGEPSSLFIVTIRGYPSRYP